MKPQDENLDTNEASWDGNQNIRLASGNERSDDPIPIAAAQPNLIVKKQPQQPTQQGAMAELTGLSTASFDFRKSSHPLACFFTMAFKVSAVLWYALMKKSLALSRLVTSYSTGSSITSSLLSLLFQF